MIFFVGSWHETGETPPPPPKKKRLLKIDSPPGTRKPSRVKKTIMEEGGLTNLIKWGAYHFGAVGMSKDHPTEEQARNWRWLLTA